MTDRSPGLEAITLEYSLKLKIKRNNWLLALFWVWEWTQVLPALHYSVDFIFLSFGIMGFIVELWNY